jgi:3-oxoacyl-(acyl-carrier-protein) synthase
VSTGEPARPLEVVVTGAGPLCAAGAGTAELLASLDAGATPVESYDPAADGVPAEPFPLYCVRAQRVRECLAAAERDELPQDPELRLALAALRLTLADAKLDASALSRAALVLTWEAPGIDSLQRSVLAALLEFPRAGSSAAAEPLAGQDGGARARFREFYARHREAFYRTQSFLHLHLAARALDLHGPTLFVNNACASGLHALEAAAQVLRSGQAEVALVAAAECPRFPTKMLWFDELGLYARDGKVRPFDAERSGVVFGEAGAALVLETREHARRRGARAYAEYLGGVANQEAWKIAVPDLTKDFYEEALRGACARAGIAPADVDVLNVHGAATALSDLYEARGITRVWGEWPSAPQVVALKPFFGHALGASALLETCALLALLEAQRLPGTPGFSRRDPRLAVAPRTAAGPAAFDTVLKMANGFAGFNAAALFRRAATE